MPDFQPRKAKTNSLICSESTGFKSKCNHFVYWVTNTSKLFDNGRDLNPRHFCMSGEGRFGRIVEWPQSDQVFQA